LSLFWYFPKKTKLFLGDMGGRICKKKLVGAMAYSEIFKYGTESAYCLAALKNAD
jgi:hypothetical protein